MAGPHVQLQTGSLSGGNIPQGILWPRRWWREALRRRNAIQECRSLNGPDSISKVNQILTPTLAGLEITDPGGCSLWTPFSWNFSYSDFSGKFWPRMTWSEHDNRTFFFFNARNCFSKIFILIKGLEIKMRIITKKCSRFSDAVSQKMAFTTLVFKETTRQRGI